MKKVYPFIIVLIWILFLIVEPILTVKIFYHALGNLDGCQTNNQQYILYGGAILSLVGVIVALLMSIKLRMRKLKILSMILIPFDLLVGFIVVMTAACFF